MSEPPAFESPSEDREQPTPASRTDYLFTDLAIDPPLVEFRRLFAKKLRAFETAGENEERVDLYRKAFALGESKLLRRLGEEEPC